MKLTEIIHKQGNRYTLEVDGEYFFIVDAEIIAQFHLRCGMEVDEQLLARVKQAAEERRARERAYHLLSYRDHGERELYDKLRRNVSPEAAAKAVAQMVEQGFVSDSRYAEKLAEHYLTVKRFSKRRAMFEMTKKGMPKALAEEALSAFEVDPKEQIQNIVEQKYRRTLSAENGRQRVVNALLRQGFGYSDIKAVLAAYTIEEEEDSWQYE